MGSSCTFKHDTSTFPASKPGPRCFNCGSMKHKKPDCEFPGGPKHKKEPPPPPNPPGPPTAKQMSSIMQASTQPGTETSGQQSAVSKAMPSSPDEILAKAASMLQGLRISAMALSGSSSEPYSPPQPLPLNQLGLLDGGATNPLRRGTPDELGLAVPVTVQLAAGTCELWLSNTQTILSAEEVMPIVPLGVLSRELRCSIQWDSGECQVHHPSLGSLPIHMINEFPYVPVDMAHQLIHELEILRPQRRVQMLRVHSSRERLGLSVDEAWHALRQHARSVVDLDALDSWVEGFDAAIFNMMVALLPDAPADQVAEAVGVTDFEVTYQCPWNRRKRRSLERSKGVLLHLFSGENRWAPRYGTQYQALEVEVSKGCDLLSYPVWSYLLRLGRLGLIRGIVGGPPCNTFTRLRSSSAQANPDDAPRRVRARIGPEIYGLPNLTPSESSLVRDHNLLWMRTFLLMVLSSAMHDDTFHALESPEDPINMSQPSEHDATNPSIWQWPCVQELSRLIGLWRADFDQGCLGHRDPKPTSLLTSSWYVFVTLHQRRLNPRERSQNRGG